MGRTCCSNVSVGRGAGVAARAGNTASSRGRARRSFMGAARRGGEGGRSGGRGGGPGGRGGGGVLGGAAGGGGRGAFGGGGCVVRVVLGFCPGQNPPRRERRGYTPAESPLKRAAGTTTSSAVAFAPAPFTGLSTCV